jgi:hypothetical protein
MKKIPKEVSEFYDSLENFKSLNIWNIQKELLASEKVKGKWREKIVCERKILILNLDKGILNLNSQSTDISGKVNDFEVFSKDEIVYLKERLNVTSNSWLKSRYSHILWNETKNKTYATIAIHSYIDTINRIIPNEVRELTINLSAIFHIAKKTKEHIEEIKKYSFDLISQLPNWLRGNILRELLDFNLLNKSELNGMSNEVINWIEINNPTSYNSNKEILKISLKLYEKIVKPNEILFNLLAKNEDLIINQHQDDSDFVKYTSTGAKMNYYKKAKNEVEYETELKEYTRLKQKIKLGKISIDLNDEENQMFNDYLNIKSQAILQLPTESILGFFSVNEDILVDPINNIQSAEKSIKNSIHHLFSTSVFDINSNFKNLKESEKLDHQIIQNYTIVHNVTCYSLFLKVFVDGILSGKLNYYKVFDFFEKHTWFGLKFHKSISQNEIDENSNWLSVLSPGIQNMFSQFELSILMNTNKVNNFILAINSLTLKFEGLLRDFIRLTGGFTTIEKKEELQEQLLEGLLENQKIKEYFTKKDIELFKYTFTKKGKNIRNNVAHSFMEYSNYNLQIVCLVFFCILRLGKYTFDHEKTSS